jgi:anti-anti-sigma factor
VSDRVRSFIWSVDVAEVPDAVVCHVEGHLDRTTASSFREAFVACVGRPGLVIDLSEMVYIDGAGLTALVGAIRRARNLSTEVAIACSPARLRKVLEHVGLSLIVSLCERTEDALADVRSAPAVRRPSA